MPQSVNDTLLDWAVSHQLDLQHYGNGTVNRMLALLNRVDPDLMAALQSALERLPADSYTVQRLDSMLASVRELNGKAYEQFTEALKAELQDLTDYEAGFQQQSLASVVPAKIAIAEVVPQQVYAAALARPFQGRLLKEWAAGIEEARMTRIRDALRIGYVENQTISQMVQRIRGTRSLKYTDGLLQIDRRHAEAVVRTAISHTANFARDAVYEANSEVIKAEQWVSVLDTRTSPICMELSGKLFPVGKGKRPPAHWNCRSVRVPVLKSWKELGFKIDEIQPSTQASMDGQVPAQWSYNDWLKRQSAARQDEILGQARGKLYRANELSVDRFVNRQGTFITLEELRKRDAELFVKAGI